MARHEQPPLPEHKAVENDIVAIQRSTQLALTTKYEALDKAYGLKVSPRALEPKPWSEMPPLPHPTSEPEEYKASGDRLSVRARRVAHRVGNSAVAQGFKDAYQRGIKGRDADDNQEFDLWAKGYQPDPEAQRQRDLDRVDEINAARAADSNLANWGIGARSIEESTGANLEARLENIVADLYEVDVPTLETVLAAREAAYDLIEQDDGTFQDRAGNAVDQNLAAAITRNGDFNYQRGYAGYLEKRADEINAATTYESLPDLYKQRADSFISHRPEGVTEEQSFEWFKAYVKDESGRYNQLVGIINDLEAAEQADLNDQANQPATVLPFRPKSTHNRA